MGWPTNAVFEVITAGVTTAKKSLADALQNAIIGIYGGTKSVYSVSADGTGNQDSSATPPGNVAATNDVTAFRFVKGKRLKAQGTAIGVGDFDFPNTNFGNTSTVTNVSGDDMHFRFQVNSVGAAQANPGAVRLTFKDGTFTDAPRGIAVLRLADNAGDYPFGVQVDCTATTAIITYRNTATAGRSYYFDVLLIG